MKARTRPVVFDSWDEISSRFIDLNLVCVGTCGVFLALGTAIALDRGFPLETANSEKTNAIWFGVGCSETYLRNSRGRK